jgi:hypothetical protein
VYKVQAVVGIIEISAIVVARAVYAEVVVISASWHVCQACEAEDKRCRKLANFSKVFGTSWT